MAVAPFSSSLNDRIEVMMGFTQASIFVATSIRSPLTAPPAVYQPLASHSPVMRLA